jgi:hypothetical protein
VKSAIALPSTERPKTIQEKAQQKGGEVAFPHERLKLRKDGTR